MFSMKKIIISLAIFLAVSSLIYGQNVKNRAIKRGLILNTSIGIVTSKAGLQIPNQNWDKLSYFNFQLGTRWYIKPQPKWGLGIQVSWFDILYSESTAPVKQEIPNESWLFDSDMLNNKFFSTSLFTVGPVGTFAITPNVAIDGYYNIRPTFVMAKASGIEDQPGFGVSHLVGFSFRVGVFSIGADYIFGDIKSLTDAISSSIDDVGGDVTVKKIGKIKTEMLRLNIGVKF